MQDIRLKTRRLTVGGKEYELVCNMNVLADLQEMHDGDINEALNITKHGLRTALETAALMLNEANDISGDPKRFTARELGRILPPAKAAQLQDVTLELITAALSSVTEDEDEPADETEESKNA